MIDQIAMGLDPGTKGAAVIIYKLKSGKTHIESIKFEKLTEVEIGEFFNRQAKTINDNPYAFKGYLEEVHAVFGSSAGATFKFGENFGFVKGCLAASKIPWEHVKPTVWQRAYKGPMTGKKSLTKAVKKELLDSIPAFGISMGELKSLYDEREAQLKKDFKKHNGNIKKDHKNELKNIAHRLFPTEKIVLDNADAFLIADYAMKTLLNQL